MKAIIDTTTWSDDEFDKFVNFCMEMEIYTEDEYSPKGLVVTDKQFAYYNQDGLRVPVEAIY